MKTLCLILNSRDKFWITNYIKKHSDREIISIVAPTFEGRVLASDLNLNYHSYQEISWNLRENELYDTARSRAYHWQFIDDLQHCQPFQNIREFRGYPLITMHQSYMMLPILEVLQSRELMSRILKLEKPDKIVFSRRPMPFSLASDRYAALTNDNGLEREAARMLTQSQNIDITEIDIPVSPSGTPPRKPFSLQRKTYQAVQQIYHRFPKIELMARRWQQQLPSPQQSWPKELNGKKILIFAWGGYYLDYFTATLSYLRKKNAKISLVICGGKISPAKLAEFKAEHIRVFKREHWPVITGNQLQEKWQNDCNTAMTALDNNNYLSNYFSDQYGSYYSGMVSEIIRREIVGKIPKTVVELKRSETIISDINPELVFAHFSINAEHACNVLAARQMGIPTLTMDHGVSVTTESVRDTYTAEFITTIGEGYRSALLKSTSSDAQKVFSVGDTRMESIAPTLKKDEAKRIYGLDTNAPLCLFCDCSGWTHDGEKRHSTWQNIQAILNLKVSLPHIQIIYRVHHGTNYREMQTYFEKLDVPGLIFQVSPDPPLTEIVQAADVVISHRSTAITESLLNGVPVIYLCALSRPEVMFLDCKAITVANAFDNLAEQVDNLLNQSYSRDAVKNMIQEYLNKYLCGNDGQAANRLGEIILDLAEIPREDRMVGFTDWIQRIESTCQAKIKDLTPSINHHHDKQLI